MNGRDELSAESHYLNALEALDGGDRDRAIKEAQRATKLDPDHLEAWSVYVDACLPAGVAPSMKDGARALAAIKKIVAADPSRMDMWVRGGRLMADELGMLHDALHWWQACREVAPDEVTPVVEIASILADMGEYSEAQLRLQAILDDNMDVGMTQFRKINGLLNWSKQPLSNNRMFSDPTRKITTAGTPFVKKWENRPFLKTPLF